MTITDSARQQVVEDMMDDEDYDQIWTGGREEIDVTWQYVSGKTLQEGGKR